MLIQFSVENYLSYRDRAVLSMVATSDQSLPHHIVASESSKGGSTLRVAAIYGANASGKSNIVKAMAFAKRLIVHSTEPDQRIGVTPFKLDQHVGEPSNFQFIFNFAGTEYTYGFTLDSHRVHQEYLYAKRAGGRKSVYFERVTDGSLNTEIDTGSRLCVGAGARQYFRFKGEDTRHNELFLSALISGNMQRYGQAIMPVRDWFLSVLTIIEPETVYGPLQLRVHRTEALKGYLGHLLAASGTGITSVDTTEEPLDWERDLPLLPQYQRDEVLQRLQDDGDDDDHGEDTTVAISSSYGDRYYLRRSADGKIMLLQLYLEHRRADGNITKLRLTEESDGTQRIINLAPMLFEISSGRNRVLVVDELDRRLHPHISKMIVESVMDCPGSSQLIFTTHDTNLLDQDLIRRDEIWFAEKDRVGASQLYSLAEFKVRPDLQLEKGYLNGRFGAVPVIGDTSVLSVAESASSYSVESHA